MCSSFLIDHFIKHRFDKFNPILVFAAVMLFTSYGQYMAYANIDKKNGEYFQYFKYAILENSTEAMEIYFCGVLTIILGFNLAQNQNITLPRIEFKLQNTNNYGYFFFVSLGLLMTSLEKYLPGSLGKIVLLFPYFSIFVLNIIGHKYNISKFKRYAIILTDVLVGFQFANSFLRFNIIQPIIVYIISSFLATQNTKFIFELKSLGILLILVVFFNVFHVLGKLRTMYHLDTYQRFQYVMESLNKDSEDEENDEKVSEDDKNQTVLARSTVINQLTQVVKLQKKEGFYNGETIAYLAYAFIPRFIWPDKPKIQQGAWFAEKIGLAIKRNNSINNSINMTIYGESYLNFGYFGVIGIGLLFGWFFLLLWKSTGEILDFSNIIGIALGLYLYSIASFQMGADLQIFITLIAVYLTFLSLSYALKMLFN